MTKSSTFCTIKIATVYILKIPYIHIIIQRASCIIALILQYTQPFDNLICRNMMLMSFPDLKT